MNRVIYIYCPSACHMYCMSLYWGKPTGSLALDFYSLSTFILSCICMTRLNNISFLCTEMLLFHWSVIWCWDWYPSSLKHARFNTVTSRIAWNHRESPHDMFKLSKKSTSLYCCLLKVKHARNVLQIWSTAWTPQQEIRSDKYIAFSHSTSTT